MTIPNCLDPIFPWWYWHPSVGVSIAILAAAGVLVPLLRPWEKIKRIEREWWTSVILVLLVGEIWTIHVDHLQQEAEQTSQTCKQLQQFQGIAELAKQNLLQVTGGDSYAYVIPDNFVGEHVLGLRISNEGDYPLTGINVSVARVLNNCAARDEGEHCLKVMDPGPVHPISVGTLAAHQHFVLPATIDAALGGKEGCEYFIQIGAQNGTAIEHVWFRPATDNKGYAYMLSVKRRKADQTGVDDGYTRYSAVKVIDWTEPFKPIEMLKGMPNH